MRSARVLFVLFLVPSGTLSGCGEIDGGAAFAGSATFEPSDHAYVLRYLSPPWLFVQSEGELADLAVAPSLSSTDVDHATVTLHIAPVTLGEPAAEQAFAEAHPGALFSSRGRTIVNSAGQHGSSFSAFDPTSGHTYREDFFAGAHATFRLAFDGSVPLDVPDVDALSMGFATAATGSTR